MANGFTGRLKTAMGEIRVKRVVTSLCWVKLGREDLLQYFDFIPSDAVNVQIFVQVPGGGDWSSEKLGVEDDVGLEVTWETEDNG